MDDLGRIVIPKEIRESLRLVAGSTVQVYCNENKQIIITKYSKIKNILDFAQMSLNSFNDFYGLSVYICDLDKILATNKEDRHLINASISNELYSVLQGRKIQIKQNKEIVGIHNKPKGEGTNCSQGIFPIICNGDIFGGLIFMSKENLTNFDFAKPMHKFLSDYLSE